MLLPSSLYHLDCCVAKGSPVSSSFVLVWRGRMASPPQSRQDRNHHRSVYEIINANLKSCTLTCGLTMPTRCQTRSREIPPRRAVRLAALLQLYSLKVFHDVSPFGRHYFLTHTALSRVFILSGKVRPHLQTLSPHGRVTPSPVDGGGVIIV